MKWFVNLSTFAKMMIGFGILGLISAGIGWYGVSQLSSLNADLGKIYERSRAFDRGARTLGHRRN